MEEGGNGCCLSQPYLTPRPYRHLTGGHFVGAGVSPRAPDKSTRGPIRPPATAYDKAGSNDLQFPRPLRQVAEAERQRCSGRRHGSGVIKEERQEACKGSGRPWRGGVAPGRPKRRACQRRANRHADKLPWKGCGKRKFPGRRLGSTRTDKVRAQDERRRQARSRKWSSTYRWTLERSADRCSWKLALRVAQCPGGGSSATSPAGHPPHADYPLHFDLDRWSYPLCFYPRRLVEERPPFPRY